MGKSGEKEKVFLLKLLIMVLLKCLALISLGVEHVQDLHNADSDSIILLRTIGEATGGRPLLEKA